jgi:hypothetical protein
VGEAEGIRAIGQAKAETYRAGVEAIGGQGFTAMQLMQIIGDRQVRLIPDVMVGGGGSGGTSGGLVDGLLSMLLWNQSGKDWHQPIPNGAPTPEPSVLTEPGMVELIPSTATVEPPTVQSFKSVKDPS